MANIGISNSQASALPSMLGTKRSNSVFCRTKVRSALYIILFAAVFAGGAGLISLIF